MPLHLIVALLTASLVISTNACQNDMDCSLLGDCVNGQCACDPGWTGATCGEIAQGRTIVSWPNGPDRAAHVSASWGASILVDHSGRTHLFADTTCLRQTCAHTNSAQIIHAVSTSASGGVEGPYKFVETAIPAEIENVHATWAPDGTALLYYGDHEFKFPNATCTGGEDYDQGPGRAVSATSTTTGLKNNPYPRGVKRMGIAYAANLDGAPWQFHFPEYDDSMKPFLPLVNPSPLVYPNGTTILAFRYDNGAPSPMPSEAPPGLPNPPPKTLSETNAIAIADSWRGPYRLVTAHATPNQVCEDPYIFQNKRGFHLVYHCYRGVNTGCHSFARSLEGPWTVSDTPVYNTTIVFANGTRHDFQYRERPELVFDGAVPTHLFTGVEWGRKNADYGGCASYSMLTEIKQI